MAKQKPNDQPIKHFHSKLAGVSHKNANGTSRQKNISKIVDGDSLELRPEPDNPHDDEAIAVYHSGRQIGYLGAQVAHQIATQSRTGWRFDAFVAGVTGGSGKTRGVNIVVIRSRNNTSTVDVNKYIQANGLKPKAAGGNGCALIIATIVGLVIMAVIVSYVLD